MFSLLAPPNWNHGSQPPPIGVPVDPTHELADTLIALWTAADGAGSRLTDVSGHGHHGMLFGNVAWANTTMGCVLYFDGNGDWVICDANLLTTDSPFTIAAWMRTTDTALQGIVSKTNGSGGATQDGWLLSKEPSGDLVVRFYQADQAKKQAILSAGLHDGEWHQVGFVYDGNSIYVFADAVLGSPTVVIGHSPAVSSDFQIGKYGEAATLSAHGNIGLVMASNKALSAAEVTVLYNEPWKLATPASRVSVTAKAFKRLRLGSMYDFPIKNLTP